MKKVALFLLLTLIPLQSQGVLFSIKVQVAHASQEIVFQENFEQGLSSWQINKEEPPDDIKVTSEQSYRGSKSLLMDYVNPESYLLLSKSFPLSTKILVRIFFYDNMDTTLGSIIEINNPDESAGTGLGVVTSLYPSTYAVRINSLANTLDTGVQRTEGWHMFELIVTPSGTYAKIDNEKIEEFNQSQTTASKIYLVSTWGLTGKAYYDELVIVRADTSTWEEQLYGPIQSFYETYKDTDFSDLYQNLGLGLHSNDLRTLLDTAYTFYLYGKKMGNQAAIERGKSLFFDALDNAQWAKSNDWAKGIYMSIFAKAAYSMWDQFDYQSKARIKKIIFDQAQTYLERTPESGYQGDTKAEENAWHADFLATVVNYFPDVPNKELLEEKAKCFAYHSITVSTDPEYCGIKTQTVYDDYKMENHNLLNPIYAAAAIHLLGRGALTYEVTGKFIPNEFKHNVANLYDSFLKPYTDLNTFYPQNINQLDWSGANNTLYFATLAYVYLEHLGIPLRFSLDEHMLKRSIFFYDIASEWVSKPPAKISSWEQTNKGSDSYKWFLNANHAGNVYTATTVLFTDQKPIPNPNTVFGDTNGDGKVDGLDYIIWLNNYNQTNGSGASDGDFNENGKVDGLDYVIWLNNYNL